MSETPTVDAETLYIWANSKPILVVDIRSAEECATGTIPGSINIPLDKLNTATLSSHIKNDDVVVFNCRTGKRTAMADEQLKALNLDEYYTLAGGIQDWAQQGYPINTNPLNHHTHDF